MVMNFKVVHQRHAETCQAVQSGSPDVAIQALNPDGTMVSPVLVAYDTPVLIEVVYQHGCCGTQTGSPERGYAGECEQKVLQPGAYESSLSTQMLRYRC